MDRVVALECQVLGEIAGTARELAGELDFFQALP
jgi:hypothetical protein